jgi:ferredoxin
MPIWVFMDFADYKTPVNTLLCTHMLFRNKTDEGTAKAIEEDVPASAEETAKEAMENCPVGAIGQA